MANMTSLLLIVSAFATEPQVSSEVVSAGRLSTRLADDDADLVLFYGAEHEGSMDPCGCEVRPKGGLARIDGYVRAARRAAQDTPSLLLHAGAFLSTDLGDGADLAPEAVTANEFMVQGLQLMGWDVLNLGYRDTLWADGRELGLPLVSANVGGPPPVWLTEVQGRSVAVTGVSTHGLKLLQPDGVEFTDPVNAVRDLLGHTQADLFVVLAYGEGVPAERLAALDGVDVVIEAGGFRERWEPFVVGDAVWVRARHEGARLGELRLWLDGGSITRAVDRQVDLDVWVPSTRSVERVAKAARKAK